MNYLAHMYLSGKDQEIMIGNFIADAVKGRRMDRYSLRIRQGIILHRAIDTYTDAHPIVENGRKRLHPSFHKYSGVVVDMYYDHFLAVHWDRYSKDELFHFVRQNYKILINHFAILPPKIRRLLPFMIRQDWLTSYADLVKLERAFMGLARRTTFHSGMEKAVEVLHQHYDAYKKEFAAFFPQLIRHTQEVMPQDVKAIP